MKINISEDKHTIMCPIPFKKSVLIQMIKENTGFDAKTSEEYADHILEEGIITLNPSSSLGEGANVADIFYLGLQASSKIYPSDGFDLNDLWHHPCRAMVAELVSIEFRHHPAELTFGDDVAPIMSAINQNGDEVHIVDNQLITIESDEKSKKARK